MRQVETRGSARSAMSGVSRAVAEGAAAQGPHHTAASRCNDLGGFLEQHGQGTLP